MSAEDEALTELWPVPGRRQARLNLYLHHTKARVRAPLVYSNFVVSLDGRIAVRDAQLGLSGVPKSIANPRDWRLFQELAAQADALVVSGRYVRELADGTAQDEAPVSSAAAFADLREWRVTQGMPEQPAIVVLSGALQLPGLPALLAAGRRVVVATSEQAPVERLSELAQWGVEVIVAGAERVDGGQLVAALRSDGFERIYLMAGPQVLRTAVSAGVLERLYLTTVPRILGGDDYDTIYAGPAMSPPPDFALNAMFLDEAAFSPDGGQQIFSVYERVVDTAAE